MNRTRCQNELSSPKLLERAVSGAIDDKENSSSNPAVISIDQIMSETLPRNKTGSSGIEPIDDLANVTYDVNRDQLALKEMFRLR